MLNASKLEAVAEIGGMSCEAAFDADFAPNVLAKLETLLDADGAVFYDMSGPFARPVFGQGVYRKIEPEFGRMYGEYYNTLDPCFRSLSTDEGATYLATASTLRAVGELPKYVESEYYQDFLKPQTIHTSIIFTVSNDVGLLGLFGFQRPKQREGFDDNAHLLVRLAAAPIAQALDRRRKKEPGEGQLATLSLKVGGINLSKRQLEIAKLVTLGRSNHEIAQHLRIAEKTVENHLTRIYQIIGASNRVTLAQSLSVILSANAE